MSDKVMKKNLVLDLYQVNEHAQKVMAGLGIAYQHAVPQSISDSWWFFNCENVPEPLPSFLREMTWTPEKCIGRGLSKEMADSIMANAEVKP